MQLFTRSFVEGSMFVCFFDGLFSVGFHFDNSGIELSSTFRIAVPKQPALSFDKRDVLLRR